MDKIQKIWQALPETFCPIFWALMQDQIDSMDRVAFFRSADDPTC